MIETSPSKQIPSVGVFFILDGPRFEPMAIYLASSLRHHTGDAFRIYAYCPAKSLDAISPLTRKILDQCSVDVRPLPSPDCEGEIWASPYPHGNKILAALDARETDFSFFMDTDMACVSPDLSLHSLVGKNEVAAVVSDYKTWGGAQRWKQAYAMFDMDVPEERVQFHRGRQLFSPPYFNGGFVGFSETPGADQKRFPEVWFETARVLDFESNLDGLRWNLDQIALPIAIYRNNCVPHILPRKFNFNIQNAMPGPEDDPLIVHYHEPSNLANWPKAQDTFEGSAKLLGKKRYNRARSRFPAFFQFDVTNSPGERGADADL